MLVRSSEIAAGSVNLPPNVPAPRGTGAADRLEPAGTLRDGHGNVPLLVRALDIPNHRLSTLIYMNVLNRTNCEPPFLGRRNAST